MTSSNYLTFTSKKTPADFLKENMVISINNGTYSDEYQAKICTAAQVNCSPIDIAQKARIPETLFMLLCSHYFDSVVRDLEDLSRHLQQTSQPNYAALRGINEVISRTRKLSA
jgi:hypothetical protein